MAESLSRARLLTPRGVIPELGNRERAYASYPLGLALRNS